MSKTIYVQINFFGPYIKKEDIDDILNPTIENQNRNHIRNILESFFGLPVNALSKEILERYTDITTEELHLPLVPHTEKIFNRLLKPLKSAKLNYCLGDYLATIASCGVASEMLTILLWKISDIMLNNKPMTENDEKGLFGKSFEKLIQEKKLNILKTYGLINNIQYGNFISIKNSRNHYLHWWNLEIKNEKAEALNIFKKSLQLFKEITGIGLSKEPGAIKINPLLMKVFDNITDRKNNTDKE